MFRFFNQNILYILLILPILLLIYIIYIIQKKKRLSQFVDLSFIELLISEKSYFKEHLKFIIFIISLSLIIIALARPQFGSKLEDVKIMGIDIYILLDVSNSMQSEDLKPNRLENAKMKIDQLLKKLGGDRIGLVVFAGDSYIQIPLTNDYSAARLFLDAVDFNSINSQGTNFASAIDLAVKSFDYNNNSKKVIIIFSDGEDHEGNIEESIKNANEKSITIYTIGIGSKMGSPIPIYSNNNLIGYKKDKYGNTIFTKLNDEILRNISLQTNGKYYLSSNTQNELEMIFEELQSLQKTEFGSKRITEYEEKYYWFLIPAVLLLILEIFVNDKKSILWKKLFQKIEK